MARILVVDDDPDFVATTRIVLERAGHSVTNSSITLTTRTSRSLW
jgi:CheY-like chemotaxis protein